MDLKPKEEYKQVGSKGYLTEDFVDILRKMDKKHGDDHEASFRDMKVNIY